MKPFAQVFEGEMFVTYAEDEARARAAFIDHGLPDTTPEPGAKAPKPGRIREQPARKASAFVYTHPDRGNVSATIVGEVPAEFRDDDPDAVTLDLGADASEVEAPTVLDA